MNAKRKILTAIGVTLTVLMLIITTVVALNFRSYGIESAKQKSSLTAELVRDALTSHMVNGWTEDQIQFYLVQISQTQNIRDLWLVRSQSVIDEMGPSMYNEVPRDDVDVQVLNTGERAEVLDESPQEASLRVTIPYVASAFGTPNCLQCHTASEGDVLGALSMVFNISDARNTGIITILPIAGASLLFLAIAILVTNHFIHPYLELFSSLQTSIGKASDGDFSGLVQTSLTDEGGEVAKRQNELYSKMQGTITDIDEKITTLLTQDSSLYNKNPLIRSKEIISELADIYKFKRTIEFDRSKHEVYNRIAYVIHDKLAIQHFAIYETSSERKTRALVHASDPGMWHSAAVDADINECRAYRTQTVIYSDDFNHVCDNCTQSSDAAYVCVPFSINKEVGLLIAIRPAEAGEVTRIRRVVPTILSYLDAAKPVIESQLLTALLTEQSRRDPLTGLYNRKYLEEYIDKALPQAMRAKTSLGVLMLDIDFFKMVNDTYGHDIGDVVIRGLTETMNECIREADIPIRFGGEEFIVLLYNSDENGAMMVGEKIREAFEKKVFTAGKERFSKTVSVGVSLFPEDASSFWKVIKSADLALYRAKESGRNQVVRFAESMAMQGADY
ncbi:GGDEF domain-containing protein [Synechococcus sp. RSCCF101]|uniref:GGDEF domain-containing protein n=1 Tax=Synechococcus sp. RSCCF101 TaxID=2511069 RepID=UPI0012475AC3|nr:GGDEF domain-containing protein [Synechococcus sp. RSCCF101]QEY32699.1 GGDEF domain-containing protein [Synechococcus sp. RSCCF101]